MNDLSASPSVRTLPANRSLVIADSAYRNVNVQQSPYNFTCGLNAALVGKELMYAKLYWNQALFSHNNSNNELRFQINGDTTKTYVMYATPFLTFNQFDGNPPGTSFLPPQPYSYAHNMEIGLNTDVRLLPDNFTVINVNGQLQDADGFTMYAHFRYSPSKGFVFTFEPSTNPDIPVYTIRLLPCSYIENGHFVHGFGITSPSSGGIYVPRDEWCISYSSDDTPTLLPIRFVTITSPELTKDRRLISFQNSDSARSLNELAVFSLNKDYTGAYHTEAVGGDATVISKRDDYNPQSFNIAITNEKGDPLQCGDPISSLLQDPRIPNSIKQSFVFGTSSVPTPINTINRGNYMFTNLLLFGTDLSVVLAGQHFFGYGIKTTPIPSGGGGLLRNNAAVDYNNPNLFSQLNQIQQKENAFTLYYPDTFMGTFIPTIPVNTYAAGFDEVVSQVKGGWGMYNVVEAPPGPPSPPNQNIWQSRLNWYPDRNPNPVTSFQITLEIVGQPKNADVNCPDIIYFVVGLYSYTINKWVAATIANQSTYFFEKPYIVGQTLQFQCTLPIPGSPHYHVMKKNPDIQNLASPQLVQLFVMPIGKPPPGGGSVSNAANMVCFKFVEILVPNFGPGYIGHRGVDFNTTYNSPNVGNTSIGYTFGNPLADGLCEEVIHEIVTVLKDN